MERSYTLAYWPSDIGFVGVVREMPGVFGQGKTLEELEKNIQDAYVLLMQSKPELKSMSDVQTKIITLSLR